MLLNVKQLSKWIGEDGYSNLVFVENTKLGQIYRHIGLNRNYQIIPIRESCEEDVFVVIPT